jgi:hypothetical protein
LVRFIVSSTALLPHRWRWCSMANPGWGNRRYGWRVSSTGALSATGPLWRDLLRPSVASLTLALEILLEGVLDELIGRLSAPRPRGCQHRRHNDPSDRHLLCPHRGQATAHSGITARMHELMPRTRSGSSDEGRPSRRKDPLASSLVWRQCFGVSGGPTVPIPARVPAAGRGSAEHRLPRVPAR